MRRIPFALISKKRKIVYTSLLLLSFCLSCTSKKQNHLLHASSAYLKEHADNPVNWYEWGDEALQLAKKENKPLLISIGYASCHWCHEMEQESFMDTSVARVMNENFVCIKVDREERPDIDNVYTNACQLVSGNSGWPLNAFALPDGKPFFAGTYYSKQSWINLLKQIAAAYKNQNGKVVLQAQTLARGIADLEFSVLTDSTYNTNNQNAYHDLFDSLYAKLDLNYGGLKGIPKFPAPSSTEFLLQYYYLTKDKRALDAATTSLIKMALGGIYDQIGGGFSRYATDSLWRIPHFEKMLYDNAQLITVYAHAYQLTGNVFFKNIVQEIAGFVERDLTDPDGGFYSSINADTKEGEGEFYAWNYDELKRIRGINNPDLLSDYFNVSQKGNWKENKNILFTSFTPDEYAKKNDIAPDLFYNQLASAKKLFLIERNKREKPTADKKILVSWNALMLKGYLDAYAALGNGLFLQKALSNARFLEKYMFQKDGGLWRNYTNGKSSIHAFLDDYALLAKAFIRLYQLSFNKHWLDLSKQLTDYAIRNFYDEKSGMFFYSANPSINSVIRKIELADNSIPSSNSVMAEVLHDLSIYFEQKDYLDKSSRMLSRLHEQVNKQTSYYTSWCFLTGIYSYGVNEVAIMGKDALKKNLELQKNYLPLSLFMGSANEENLPLLEGKTPVGRTLVYVCTNNTCKLPVEEVTKALSQLKR
jgi:uncharacterized protein YyaL (SSP411 family)